MIALVNLAPGVTEMDDQCDVHLHRHEFCFQRQPRLTADILTDGASVTNSEPNGGITAATYLPSPEAVEEFKVEQTNFSAEYGFSGCVGGQHGHALGHEQLSWQRVQLLATTSSWTRTTGSTTGRGSPSRRLRRNNFGFTVGGPIIKNKTFLLLSITTAYARPG